MPSLLGHRNVSICRVKEKNRRGRFYLQYFGALRGGSGFGECKQVRQHGRRGDHHAASRPLLSTAHQYRGDFIIKVVAEL